MRTMRAAPPLVCCRCHAPAHTVLLLDDSPGGWRAFCARCWWAIHEQVARTLGDPPALPPDTGEGLHHEIEALAKRVLDLCGRSAYRAGVLIEHAALLSPQHPKETTSWVP